MNTYLRLRNPGNKTDQSHHSHHPGYNTTWRFPTRQGVLDVL